MSIPRNFFSSLLTLSENAAPLGKLRTDETWIRCVASKVVDLRFYAIGCIIPVRQGEVHAEPPFEALDCKIETSRRSIMKKILCACGESSEHAKSAAALAAQMAKAIGRGADAARSQRARGYRRCPLPVGRRRTRICLRTRKSRSRRGRSAGSQKGKRVRS